MKIFDNIWEHEHCRICKKPFVVNRSHIYPIDLCENCGEGWIMTACEKLRIEESLQKG